MWDQRFVDTERGRFELFESGQGEPLAVTHLYSAYNEQGNSFANNVNFNRIVDIMNQFNNPLTLVETRRKLGHEWALMSYYSEDKLKESLTKPNSGKTVGDRLDYFRKIECATYDLRNELLNVNIPSYIYAGKYDAQCPYKFGVEIADLIPNATLTTFEKSNHNPFSEEEEKFHAFVRSTLAM